MTQHKLADKMYLSNKASVSKLEANKYPPSIEQITQLADILGTTTDYLISGKCDTLFEAKSMLHDLVECLNSKQEVDSTVNYVRSIISSRKE